jgi:hypothetical protein
MAKRKKAPDYVDGFKYTTIKRLLRSERTPKQIKVAWKKKLKGVGL